MTARAATQALETADQAAAPIVAAFEEFQTYWADTDKTRLGYAVALGGELNRAKEKYEAKTLAWNGTWPAFVKEKLPALSLRRAREYMTLAEYPEKVRASAHITEALEKIREMKARAKKRAKLKVVPEDEEMPTAEECDEEAQEAIYDQACWLLETMASKTRQKYFAFIKQEYPDELRDASQ